VSEEVESSRVPAYDSSAFECPYCNVYAVQDWERLTWPKMDGGKFWKGWKWSKCQHCQVLTLWSHLEKIVQPDSVPFGPDPNPDMPKNVLDIYEEARRVLPVSVRSCAALLRLALQVLIETLEPGRGHINQKIRRLVERGLEPSAQKAMDVLRVVGNNAVHPGSIELEEDGELVPALFGLLNLVVHHVISRPRQIEALFDSLPESARQAIAKRDQPTRRKSKPSSAAAQLPSPDSVKEVVPA